MTREQIFPTTVLCFPGVLVGATNQDELDRLLKGERGLFRFAVVAGVGVLLFVPAFVLHLNGWF